MNKILRTLPAIGLLFLLSACSFSLASDITPPPGAEQPVMVARTSQVMSGPQYPLVPPEPAAGEALYAENCAPCHGATGLGNGPDASQLPIPVAAIGTAAVARQSTPEEWYILVTQGDLERSMPPFRSLTDRQRWDILAYVYSLSVSDDSLALGQELYQNNCIQCHGESGQGDGPAVANMTTRPRDFTEQAFMADTSAVSLAQSISQGIAPAMPAYADQFNESQIWALTDYLRSLSYTIPEPQVEDTPAAASPTSAPETAETAETGPYPVATAQPEVAATASPSGLGTVVVTVFNGSGAEVPADLPVTLYGFDNMQMAITETSSSGEDGVYTFENVEMPPERAFLAGVDYAGGTYGSDVATVDPEFPVLNLQVVIYEPSTDASVLTTDRLHIFFDFTDPELVQVVEVYIVSNPTSYSIVSSTSGGPVLFFPLPAGYQNLQFEEGVLGERFMETEGGFTDTTSVPPGSSQYQLVFAFNMPYDRRLEFSQPMAMETMAVVIMIPDNGVKLSSADLMDAGVRDFQGTMFQMYNGSNLAAGSSLEFSLSGKPAQSGASMLDQSSWQGIAVGLGVLGVVLVALGVWLYRRNQRTAGLEADLEEEILEAETPADQDDTDALMDAIIALDDQFQAGELPEEAYLQRRAELKERLKNVSYLE